ncbi:DUF4268 domain-containing protein [Streptomyces sp. NPDC055722]
MLAEHDALEGTYGAALTFEPLEGKQSCRIADYRDGASMEDVDDWDAFIEWFVHSQRQFREAIHARGGLPAATT